MVEGAIFIAKGIMLTDTLTRAARSWGIFDRPRSCIKRVAYFWKLLECYECTSVWVGFFVILYLSYFEWGIFTYALIFSRLAMFMDQAYQWIEAKRAVEEGKI